MLIEEWMTADVITATEDTSMLKLSRILKENNFRRIPIVDGNNKVIGIVSDRDIKDASPSKASTLDVHELYYLLSEIKAKDIMTANPICVHHGSTIEQVALIMTDKKLTGLPVINEDGCIVGIITEHDVFKVLLEITGARKDGILLAFEVSDAPGSLQPVLSSIIENGGRITSILTGGQKGEASVHDVYIRLRPMDLPIQNNLLEVLKEKCVLRYYVADKVYKIDNFINHL